MKENNHKKVVRLVYLGVLIGIMILFAFTPIGYLKFGLIEITLMVLPVAIGGIVLGPLAGAILGGVFGVTSFIQCFGMSAFGTFMFGLNPVGTAILCIVPRILCGFLGAVIFKALNKVDKTKVLAYIAGALSTALLNTIFFVGCLLLIFWKNDGFIAQMTEWQMATENIWVFVVSFVGINGLVEALVNGVVATAIAKVTHKLVRVA